MIINDNRGGRPAILAKIKSKKFLAYGAGKRGDKLCKSTDSEAKFTGADFERGDNTASSVKKKKFKIKV